jgi:hypothetical protein
MSDDGRDDEPDADPDSEPASEPESTSTLPRKVYRTVSPVSHGRADYEMGAIGWTIFLVLLFLLVPFLPVVLAVWLVSKLIGRAAA